MLNDPRLPDRFWAKVEVAPSGCWVWTGAKAKGYGVFRWEGRLVSAHRLSRAVLVGDVPIRRPTPQDPELDHTCRTPACVRPSCTDPVTHRENHVRGVGPALVVQKWTDPDRRCPAGHVMDEANTYVHRTRRGYENRQCKACRREAKRRARAVTGP